VKYLQYWVDRLSLPRLADVSNLWKTSGVQSSEKLRI